MFIFTWCCLLVFNNVYEIYYYEKCWCLVCVHFATVWISLEQYC